MKTIEFRFSPDVVLELIEIPAGAFLTGSSPAEKDFRENETPPHRVEIAPFRIGKFPVTRSQWQAV
jgi:formylglycine-generating enzyme required for sulfatase activity